MPRKRAEEGFGIDRLFKRKYTKSGKYKGVHAKRKARKYHLKGHPHMGTHTRFGEGKSQGTHTRFGD